MLCTLFDKLRDEGFIDFVGFDGPCDALQDSEVQQQQYLAQKAFDLMYHMIGQRCFSGSLLEYGLPWRFAGLVDHDESVRQRTLDYCGEAWDALQVAERRAQTSKWMRNLVGELTWAKMPWVRFVLTSLYEVGQSIRRREMTCACSAWLFALPEIRYVAFGWVRSLVGLNAPPLLYECRSRTTRSRTFVCCMVGLMI